MKKKHFQKFAKTSQRRQASRRTPPHKRRAPAKTVTVDASFQGTRYGYGFATVEGEREDIFIPAKKCGGAMHGDLVRVRYTPHYGQRQEGEVVAITEYAKVTLVGTLAAEEERYRHRAVRDRPSGRGHLSGQGRW